MKTIIYIDGSNLKLSAKTHAINYDNFLLLRHLKEKYYATGCKFFIPDFKFLQDEIQELKDMGVEVILKEVYFERGKTKANCDVEITNIITLDVRGGNVDKVILVTGDGDFVFLLNYIEKAGKIAKIVGICPDDTSKNYRSGGKFGLTYITQFVEKILKGKALAGGPARVLFNSESIATGIDLSSAAEVII